MEVRLDQRREGREGVKYEGTEVGLLLVRTGEQVLMEEERRRRWAILAIVDIVRSCSLIGGRAETARWVGRWSAAWSGGGESHDECDEGDGAGDGEHGGRIRNAVGGTCG